MKPLATGVLFLVSVAMGQPMEMMNVLQLAKSNGLNTFVALLTEAGIAPILEGGQDEFTIFAPSDEAFNRLEPALLAGIKSNQELLTTILTAHIVRDRLPSSNITNDTVSSALLNGYKLKFVVDQDGTMVNGVNVTRPDLLASNGIIHVIDKVIIPQKPGDSMQGGNNQTRPMDIFETLSQKGFPTATSLIHQSGLHPIFAGEEKYTIFTPTEEAFLSLDPNLIMELLMNSKMLQAVLKAHVVKGELRSNQISDGMMKPTLLDGYELMFFLKNSVARVNGANIVLTDMEASNGIIHVIDKVIIPPEVKTRGSGEGSKPGGPEPKGQPEPEPEPEPEPKPKPERQPEDKGQPKSKGQYKGKLDESKEESMDD